MIARLTAVAIVAAMMFSGNLNLGVLQGFAWLNMLRENLAESPSVNSATIETAVEKAFNNSDPCPYCNAVGKALRDSAPENPASPPDDRGQSKTLHLAAAAVPAYVAWKQAGVRIPVSPSNGSVCHSPPPTPPPEAGAPTTATA